MSVRELLEADSIACEHRLLLYSLGCRLVHRIWVGGELTPLSSPMGTEQSVRQALISDTKFLEVLPAKNLEISEKSWAGPPIYMKVFYKFGRLYGHTRDKTFFLLVKNTNKRKILFSDIKNRHL